MLRIAVHSSNDIQWFTWRDGVLELQEGDFRETLASNVRELETAEKIINVYLKGVRNATTRNQKAHSP